MSQTQCTNCKGSDLWVFLNVAEREQNEWAARKTFGYPSLLCGDPQGQYELQFCANCESVDWYLEKAGGQTYQSVGAHHCSQCGNSAEHWRLAEKHGLRYLLPSSWRHAVLGKFDEQHMLMDAMICSLCGSFHWQAGILPSGTRQGNVCSCSAKQPAWLQTKLPNESSYGRLLVGSVEGILSISACEGCGHVSWSVRGLSAKIRTFSEELVRSVQQIPDHRLRFPYRT